MNTPPGWYADPAGQPGLLRYWDGRAWTSSTQPVSPPVPPPATVSRAYTSAAGPSSTPTAAPVVAPRRRSPIGWILGLGALLIAVVVVAALLVSTGTRGPRLPDAKPPPTAVTCPPAVAPTASPSPPASGDRVVSGRLSYPRLPAPFTAPTWDRRVPFGRDVRNQQATVEADAAGRPTWVSSVIIARLLAGDGFYGPQQGAAVVAECITSLFYGESDVERTDSRNEATTVDGRAAWVIEAQLSFRVPDVKTTGEGMTVVVVETTPGEAGLFYTSNPDTSPQFAEPLRRARAGLRVS